MLPLLTGLAKVLRRSNPLYDRIQVLKLKLEGHLPPEVCALEDAFGFHLVSHISLVHENGDERDGGLADLLCYSSLQHLTQDTDLLLNRILHICNLLTGVKCVIDEEPVVEAHKLLDGRYFHFLPADC